MIYLMVTERLRNEILELRAVDGRGGGISRLVSMLGDLVQTTDGRWITRIAVQSQPHGEKRITCICIEQDHRSGITTVRFGQYIGHE